MSAEEPQNLEERGFKPATVYARLSRLSSFYEWAMRDPQLAGLVERNPVRLARPKAPKAYQTEGVKSLDDEQVSKLLAEVRERAAAGDVVGRRDYALLFLFVTTGMRRQELIGLHGSDVELRKDDLVIRCGVKGVTTRRARSRSRSSVRRCRSRGSFRKRRAASRRRRRRLATGTWRRLELMCGASPSGATSTAAGSPSV